MNESFEAMALRVAEEMEYTSHVCNDYFLPQYAHRIKEELCKGQEPVNCDLASTFGNFCQCKNHKLYLHPAPAVYQCPRCATSMEIDGW